MACVYVCAVFPGCDLYVPIVVGAVPGQEDGTAGNIYAVSDTEDICGWIIQPKTRTASFML